MQEVIQFNGFLIRVQWLILAFSGIFGYIILRLRLNKMESTNKIVQETIIDSLLLTVVIWKLSFILFNPVKFINNPISLIFFNGGRRGFLLALTIAMAYLIYSSGKQGISVWIYAESIGVWYLAGTLPYYLISAMLSNKLMVFYGGRSLLAALLLLWQLKTVKVIGSPENLNQILLWFSLGKIFIYHFKASEVGYDNFIWKFSLEQFLFYVLAIIAIVINLFFGKSVTSNKK
jgi:hypothetical protein